MIRSSATRPRALILGLLFALSSAPACRGGGGSGEKPEPPSPLEECARYESAYRACGRALGPVGERLLAEHATQMRASLLPAPDASERALADRRHACAEAERRVTEACR